MTRQRIRDFLKNDDGATAIEYALIAGIMGLGIILGLTQVKDGVHVLWQNISNGLNS